MFLKPIDIKVWQCLQRLHQPMGKPTRERNRETCVWKVICWTWNLCLLASLPNNPRRLCLCVSLPAQATKRTEQTSKHNSRPWVEPKFWVQRLWVSFDLRPCLPCDCKDKQLRRPRLATTKSSTETETRRRWQRHSCQQLKIRSNQFSRKRIFPNQVYQWWVRSTSSKAQPRRLLREIIPLRVLRSTKSDRELCEQLAQAHNIKRWTRSWSTNPPSTTFSLSCLYAKSLFHFPGENFSRSAKNNFLFSAQDFPFHFYQNLNLICIRLID